MRILIIRHGDPYYPTDSLTEKGNREAELLSEKLINEGITDIYVSPHGRAKLTATPTAGKLGIKPVELEWLREFPEMLNLEYETDYFKNMKSPWNIPPELWTKDQKLFDINNWRNSDILKGSKVVERYDYICNQFDELVAKYGFVRNGNLYDVTEKGENSTETVTLFCHFGLGTALISHVLNMPFGIRYFYLRLLLQLYLWNVILKKSPLRTEYSAVLVIPLIYLQETSLFPVQDYIQKY